jgi:hypothetical protein
MNIGSDVVSVHMQCTVFVMALIGMAVYSTTYALMYAATAVATVPVLEMWMVTTHLTCAALSVLFSRHHVKITHSIFLGVACGITILSNDCIQYGNCELYFGAAAVPRIAAAGAIAWAWVMYVVSFDGMPDTFIAALAMAMVPLAIEAKTVAVCGDKWRHQLGANDLMWVRETLDFRATTSHYHAYTPARCKDCGIAATVLHHRACPRFSLLFQATAQ